MSPTTERSDEHVDLFGYDVADDSHETRRTVTEAASGGDNIITVQDITIANYKHTINLTNGETVEVWSTSAS